MSARLPIASHLACALALVLGASKLAVARQVWEVDGSLDPLLGGEGLLLLACSGWVLWRRSVVAALLLFLASLWTFHQSLAPVLGGSLADAPGQLRMFLGPFEIAAWLFVPACFLGWRRLAALRPARDATAD